jgi:hypothetical protein
MTITGARWILAAIVVSVLGAWAVAIAGGLGVVGWGFPGAVAMWGIGFAVVGTLIVRTIPRHPVGTLLLAAGAASAFVDVSFHLGGVFEWDGLVATVSAAGWMVAAGLFTTALARFPDGEWAFRGAREATAVLWVIIAAALLAAPFLPYLDSGGGMAPVHSPWEADWSGLPAWVPELPRIMFQIVSFGIMISSGVASFRSDPIRRRQIGLVAFTLVALGIGAAVASALDGFMGTAFAIIVSAGVTAIPVAMLVGIMRYRLYDLDRLVSRTISYLVTIGTLAGVYVTSVIVLRSFVPVEGDLRVAISTLAVAVAFLPLARRVQTFVDRRFFRSRYDAAQVVARVADELSGSLDLADVTGWAESVVDEVFAPDSVGVWLADGAGVTSAD